MRTSQVPASGTEDGGFTLVEILVVLVIVSVGFGMVAFSIAGSGPKDELQREAERLASWIRVATDWAAERGRPCNLRYDLDRSSLEVWAQKEGQKGPVEIAEHQVRAPVRIGRLVLARGEQVVVEGGRADVWVLDDGICEPHLVTLHLEGAGSLTLEVNPVTGDVVIFAGTRDYVYAESEIPFGR